MEQFAKTNSAVDPSLDINISQVDLICVNQYIENKNYIAIRVDKNLVLSDSENKLEALKKFENIIMRAKNHNLTLPVLFSTKYLSYLNKNHFQL